MHRLGGVGVRVDPETRGVPRDVLVIRVRHGQVGVCGEHAAVGRQGIGRNDRAGIEPTIGCRADGCRGVAGDALQNGTPAPLDHGQLEVPPRPAAGRDAGGSATMHLPRRFTGVDLVHLNDARKHDPAVCLHLSDPMSGVPGHLVGDPEHLRELAGGDALGGGGDEPDARSHCPRGSFVRCMAVPEVTVNWRRHFRQVNSPGRDRCRTGHPPARTHHSRRTRARAESGAL
jgi:hypothetical protein